ncbi:hypothetical protein ABH927_004100 [Planotetraspora sp. GP83]
MLIDTGASEPVDVARDASGLAVSSVTVAAMLSQLTVWPVTWGCAAASRATSARGSAASDGPGVSGVPTGEELWCTEGEGDGVAGASGLEISARSTDPPPSMTTCGRAITTVLRASVRVTVPS